jgi:Activator of Hsp90 ATPase homolog 1-like protein
MRLVAASVEINAQAEKILPAFLKQEHLKAWWGVERSLIDARAGGVYTLAWNISEQGIRYVFTGVIEELIPGEYLMIKNLVYLNPERTILGPMGLEIDLIATDDKVTKVGVVQSGYKYGGDWDCYYEAVLTSWPQALEMLKNYLEKTLSLKNVKM